MGADSLSVKQLRVSHVYFLFVKNVCVCAVRVETAALGVRSVGLAPCRKP